MNVVDLKKRRFEANQGWALHIEALQWLTGNMETFCAHTHKQPANLFLLGRSLVGERAFGEQEGIGRT